MKRILDIAKKDLIQIVRDWKVFLFMLIMPIAFTMLFGFAFGGFKKDAADTRLPVAYINEDRGDLSLRLVELLDGSETIAITQETEKTLPELEKLVKKGKLAGVLVIPAEYSDTLLAGGLPQLGLYIDLYQGSGMVVNDEVQACGIKLSRAAQTALIVGRSSSAFYPAFENALAAWQNPPVKVNAASAAVQVTEGPSQQIRSLAHTSPGMIMQFALAGLLTCATVIVNERKTRCLQRLLTTATKRSHILLGHYLAILMLVLGQFLVLILFGQWILHIDYFRQAGAILLVAVTASLCISAMGLLIGVIAKSEEQAISFSLILMFVFSGLGGAWVPLENTSSVFQAAGHLTPVAWAMDGFMNITIRMQGFESVLVPAGALAGYAITFFLLAVWKFRRMSE